MDNLEIIYKVTGILASVGILGGIGKIGKLIKKKYCAYIQKKIERQNVKSLSNDVKIYKMLVQIAQENDFNFAHIISLHDSGDRITELSKKKLTIKWEYTASKMLLPKADDWDERRTTSDMIRFITILNIDDIIYCDNILKVDNTFEAVTEIYNTKQGKELLFIKIGWFGKDKFIFAGFQRDTHEYMESLSLKQRAFIKYKCEELSELLS